jgi:thymidylate synthase
VTEPVQSKRPLDVLRQHRGYLSGMHPEYQYLDILAHFVDLYDKGRNVKGDPQGVGNIAETGFMMKFDLSLDEFPVLTTKKINLRPAVGELLWFLSGEQRIDFLHERGIKIWDLWAEESVTRPYGREVGDPGPIYGPKWVHCLRSNPHSRRGKVIAWDPAEVDNLFLVPCHGDFHVTVIDGRVNLNHTQRSGDWFIGIPFNIIHYALMVKILAQVSGLRPGILTHFVSDLHLYTNHIDQARLQLTREPRPFPRLKMNPDITDIFRFRIEDFELEGYDPHPFIKAPVAQ